MFVILSQAINDVRYWRLCATTNKYSIALYTADRLRKTQIIEVPVIIAPRNWIKFEEKTFNGVWVQLEVPK